MSAENELTPGSPDQKDKDQENRKQDETTPVSPESEQGNPAEENNGAGVESGPDSVSSENPEGTASGADAADHADDGDDPQTEAAEPESGDGGGTDGPDEPGDGGDEPDEDDSEAQGSASMGLLDHLGELRQRLVRSVLATAVGMIACYGFAEKLFDILMKPMKEVLDKHAASQLLLPEDFFVNLQQSLEQVLRTTDFKYFDQLPVFMGALRKSLGPLAMSGHFQYTYPAEAFFAHIKISIVAGIFLMSPVIFTQIWGFIAPGLYAHERRWVIPMAIVSAVFFVAGGVFGYFVVFPFGFDFFASFASSEIAFTPKLNEYLSFCLKLLFAFGVVFELPLFIFFLARLGVVTSKGLRKKRKYAILLAFVTSAVLTPPDPFTQCLMAGPLIILYELGVWVAYFFGKKKPAPEPEPEDDSESGPAGDDDAEEDETVEDDGKQGQTGDLGTETKDK